MSAKKEKKYYSPQVSEMAVVSIRRLAWALKNPMTATVEHMVMLLPSKVDPAKVCFACRDKTKCSVCVFGIFSADPAALAELALLK